MYKGKRISICTLTYNNYEGLVELINSCEKGSIIPDYYVVIDNGKKIKNYQINIPNERLRIIQEDDPIGGAEGWNYFMTSTPEERIIVNDDIIFGEDAIQKIVDTEGDLVFTTGMGINKYSLFLVRDSCIKKVGYFDDAISPHYFYFEDNDYDRRIMLDGTVISRGVDAPAIHKGSQTMLHFTTQELKKHHFKFRLAKVNYIIKWGGEPNKEIYSRPFNK